VLLSKSRIFAKYVVVPSPRIIEFSRIWYSRTFFRLKNNFEQKKGIRDKKCKKKLGGIARIAEELGREKCFFFLIKCQ
jgi:hypothetical protein